MQPDPRPSKQVRDGRPGAGSAASLDWPRILAENEGWLRTIVFARVGEPQAVEEVMQEVALAAVRQKAPLQDPTKVQSWLYRLAVMQSLLYRRKQGRRRKLIDRYAQRTRPTEGDARQPDPLGWLLSEERHRQVRSALKRLSSRDAEILLLKYTKDWSYHEIAARLGVSESAVEARLHRARQRMRTELATMDVVSAEC
ncbi:MAG: sigma-70 family RNA polymerase sigma factor [Pirellulales bacterium]|nr:sigma-70 family RNA polymerase sigma factor [Pirellulales bacterium]